MARAMKKLVCTFFLAGIAWAQPFAVGQRIQLDTVFSTSPENARWVDGSIIGVAGKNYVIMLDDGRKREYEIEDNPRWLRAGSSPAAPATAPPAPAAAPAARAGVFRPGDRVQVDTVFSTSPENALWTNGTVLRIEGNRYIIRLDDGREKELYVDEPRWVRKGSGVGSVTPPPEQRAAPAPTTPAGQGAPPSGVYTVGKISGSHYMVLGKLEFQGSNYRGLSGTTWHPYRIEGGNNIVFTGGLRGMPDGWRITEARYVGGDTQGRPVVVIYYETGRSRDRMDAIRE